MATTPNQKPVPSEDYANMRFNAGKLDEFVTSTESTYTDRLGQEHMTAEGIRASADDLRSDLASSDAGKGASLVNTSYGQSVEQILTQTKRANGLFQESFANAVTYNIPSDYANMQLAIDDLHSQTISQGKKIIINLESGYQEKYGLKVQNGDFSKFYIKSATGNTPVPVADDFIGVVGPDGGTTITSGSVIMAYHAKGPVLGCIFDGRQIARTLYFALGGSHGWSDRLQSSTEEAPNATKIAGGLNFRHATFQAQEGSIIVCENAIATGCLLNSIYCERNSIIHAEFCDVQNATGAGVIAMRGGVVNADTVNANGCGIGFWAARGGVISASDSTANNCKGNGYRCDTAGRINAHHTSATGCLSTYTGASPYAGITYVAYRSGEIAATGSSNASSAAVNGLLAINGGKISAQSITASTCTSTGIQAQSGGSISADSAIVNGSVARAVYALNGGEISINNSTITNSGGSSVTAESGSHVSCVNSTITTSTSGSCVYANSGGKVDCYGSTVNGQASGQFGLRANTGGIITANTATYSTANITINTRSSDGIIVA